MENLSSFSLLGKEQEPTYLPTSDERLLAVLSHVLTLVGSFVPPLVIYILKNKESSFVASHARESLNFQITMIIASIICFLLVVVLIGVPLIIFLGIMDLVWVVIASVRSSESKLYLYPFNLRLIK